MLSVYLNIITILLVLFTFYVTYRVFDQKKDTGITPLQVYKSLIDDMTAESVTRALTIPKVGDVGSFIGYDYPSFSEVVPSPIDEKDDTSGKFMPV